MVSIYVRQLCVFLGRVRMAPLTPTIFFATNINWICVRAMCVILDVVRTKFAQMQVFALVAQV